MAAILGEQSKVLSYWLYRADLSKKYTQYSIPKKNGGWRIITAPQDGLKRIQTKLARLLADIYNDIEQRRLNESFDGVTVSQCVLSHGFKDNYSIITNAKIHVGKRFVFNTDLENFFPSISFGRVRGFFINDRNFRLHEEVATTIAQIACYQNQLPQGAPCSPIISNFIGHMLDIKLNKMAKKGNCSYTRYADDLTFSTNEKHFPAEIARLVAGTADRWVAGNGLISRVYASGFRINHDKSRMQLPMSRQETTGLTVNQKVNVAATYYKTARSMCDRLFKEGYCFEIVSGKWVEVPAAKLQGRMDFIHSVRRGRLGISLDHVPKKRWPTAYRNRENIFREQQRAFTSIYEKLLNYRSFHEMAKPTIVGEGITDGLYINAAIRTIGGLYPRLYDPSGNGTPLVDFYKHSDKRKIYQIGEGAKPLREFAKDYSKLMEPFKTKPSNPVIVVIDNDKEGRECLTAIGKRWGKTIDGTSSFYHLTSNLYVVPVPASGTTLTSIEDLFDSTWLAAQDISGRKFTKDNDFDSATHFGKTQLAGQIVRPKRASIKWDGFKPLLQGIQDAILDFELQSSAGT